MTNANKSAGLFCEALPILFYGLSGFEVDLGEDGGDATVSYAGAVFAFADLKAALLDAWDAAGRPCAFPAWARLHRQRADACARELAAMGFAENARALCSQHKRRTIRRGRRARASA